jgi:hypothetical protein
MKTSLEVLAFAAIIGCGFYLNGQAQAPVADPNPNMARLAVRELPPLEPSQPFLVPASFGYQELQAEIRGREVPAGFRIQGRSEKDIKRSVPREKRDSFLERLELVAKSQ